MPSPTADREIIISRTVNAPRSLVWEAWTTPEHLAKWWGPNGFTITTKEFSFSEGGQWRFVMHGPDGRDYPNHIVFTKIEKPKVITHDHGGDDGKVHFQAVITFEEKDGKTEITMKSIFPSKEELEHVVKEYGAIEGGKQTLAKMAAYAESLVS
jgi:uncharacterized protein YndB with AHSA1/START domain